MTEFDKYSGLFAENGDFDMPATYTLGLAYAATPNLTLLLDYQGILYEGVPSVSNSINNLLDGSCVDALNNTLFSGSPSTASGHGCLGSANGAGFGWKDMHVVKFGVEYQDGDDVYRFGISNTNQPIGSGEVNFNLLAPGVIEQHYSLGYTTLINEREWTFFAMYMPPERVSGRSVFDPGQTLSFEMHQFEVGFAISF